MPENNEYWWYDNVTLETVISTVTAAVKSHAATKTRAEIVDAFNSGFVVFLEKASEGVKRNIIFSRGYLYNATLNFLRNESRRYNKQVFINTTDTNSAPFVDTCNIELITEVEDEVNHFLKKLPEDMKTVIQGTLLGKKLHEIAKESGIPLKTIEKRHERAIKKMRESAELERERERERRFLK